MFQPLGDPHFPPVSLRMDLANLFADLDLLAPAGVVLGTETKSALQTSLFTGASRAIQGPSTPWRRR